MNTRFLSSALLCIAATGAALAASAPETPLLEDKGVKVNVLDFEATLLRMPEAMRPQARASYDGIATMLDQVYVNRKLAARAREAGIDKDAAVARRLQQVQESFLAEQYGQYFDRQAKFPDLDQRASELYKADPKQFTGQEQVHVQHILVNLWGRTREMAEERVKSVLAEARAGGDFLALAKKYSDDPSARNNSGDLGVGNPKAFEASFAEAISKMKPNEIAGPVETRHGFHVIKFVRTIPSQVTPFASVRNRLVQQERDKILKQRRETLLADMRETDTVVVHKANIDALVVPLDPKSIGAAARETK